MQFEITGKDGSSYYIEVSHFRVVGGKDTWDSDVDYYGYEEVEFTVKDENGREVTEGVVTKQQVIEWCKEEMERCV